MIFKNTCFSKEGSRGGQDECKNDGFRTSEFHAAFRERVFSFCWRQEGPLGAAKACVMANDDGYSQRFFNGFAFRLERFRRRPRGCKNVGVGAKQGPGTPPESV